MYSKILQGWNYLFIKMGEGEANDELTSFIHGEGRVDITRGSYNQRK